ncbi:hypothetical protein D3C74_504240 [compost metagenome]
MQPQNYTTATMKRKRVIRFRLPSLDPTTKNTLSLKMKNMSRVKDAGMVIMKKNGMVRG